MLTRLWFNTIMIISLLLTPLGFSQAAGQVAQAASDSDDLPGWPLVGKAIPYHEPGRPSKAEAYTTQAKMTDENGLTSTVQLRGVDAVVADGDDPLAANYKLIQSEKVLRGSLNEAGTAFAMDSLSVTKTPDGNATIAKIANSEYPYGNFMASDVAAGDLNKDYFDEQISAWLDGSNRLKMAIGEMPGSAGKTSSAPAVVATGTAGKLDLLVRGYDDALWHCLYDVSLNQCAWDAESTGGMMLSAPGVVSKGAGAFNVYAVLSDGHLSNQVFRRSYQNSAWNDGWQAVGSDTTYWPDLSSLTPFPELPAPAAAEVAGVTYLFRKDATHPLSWWRSDDLTWRSLETAGFPLMDYAPAVVALNENTLLLLAVNVSGAVMMRQYNIPDHTWSQWGLAQDIQRNIPGVKDVIATSAPLAVAAGGGIDIYARGSDQQLWKAQCISSPANHNDCEPWAALGGTLSSALGGSALGDQTYLFTQNQARLLQSYHDPANGWEVMTEGITACCAVFDTGLTGTKDTKLEPYQNFSVDVETGHFLGDGRSQIVLGYFSSPRVISLALFDISDSITARGFTPELLSNRPVKKMVYTTTWTLEADTEMSSFRIATGDFLGKDGVDDIAVMNFSNDQRHYAVNYFKVNRATAPAALEQQMTQFGYTGDTTATIDPVNPVYYAVPHVAAGDFNGDKFDELVVRSDARMSGFNSNYYCDEAYLYRVRTRIYTVNANNSVTETEVSYGEWITYNEVDIRSFGMELAAGDVNGDRNDEILQTWPSAFGVTSRNCLMGMFWYDFNRSDQVSRWLQIISFPNGITTSPVFYTFPNAKGYSANTYNDQLVAGDFDLDLKDEILWQVANNNDLSLFAYESRSGAYTEAGSDPNKPWRRTLQLVAGDFTGESLRVGAPSYRMQSGVITPTLLLNMPPKHRDIIDGVVIDELGTDNIATYTSSVTNTTYTTMESKRDWGISAGLEAGGGAMGVTASLSLRNSYGQNFSDTTSKMEQVQISERTEAQQADKIIYNATDYDVWIYPVYGVPAGPNGPKTITVVWPRPEFGLNTNPPKGKPGDSCIEGFYAPRHQPYNAWSYDSASLPDSTIPDLDAVNTFYYKRDTNPGSTLTITTSSDSKFSTSSGWHNSLQAGAEVSYENKIPLVSDVFEYNFKVSVDADYSTASTTTLDIQLTSSTEVVVNIPSTTTNGLLIKTFVYWAKDGYLVVDYRTNIDPLSTYWRADAFGIHYTKPDPAFILPWYGWLVNNVIQSPCGDMQLYSNDIGISPSYAENGDTVTLSATVRNFSYKQADSPIIVNFYLGQPAAGNPAIGSCSIDAVDLVRANGPQTCSIPWQVAGASGKERIFAVIDPQYLIDEVHEEGDIIDNNTGYNVLNVAKTDYVEPAAPDLAADYKNIYFQQAAGQTQLGGMGSQRATSSGTPLSFSLDVPKPNGTSQTLRYQLLPVDVQSSANTVGSPVRIIVSAGDTNTDGHLAEVTTPFDPQNPPVLVASYRDSDLPAGYDENKLVFYRWTGSVWVDATCPGTLTNHYPLDNTVSAAVCQPGTYALVAPNTAPSLAAGTPAVEGIIEDQTDSGGTLVSTMLTGFVTDPDPGNVLQGIAVTSASNPNGKWQYSLDETTWNDLNGVSNASARLLPADTTARVRFVPDPNYNGTAAFTFRAWDQTSGSGGSLANTTPNGGTTAFSAETRDTQIVITPVNDPPSFTAGKSNVVVRSSVKSYSAGWATAISAGPADEIGQTLTFYLSNNNNGLFEVQPSISADGILTFTLAAGTISGTARITVTLKDNGGKAYGGADSTDPQTFTITISPYTSYIPNIRK